MSYRISGLEPAAFAPLFDLDDAALAARNARRIVADAPVGFPCRVSLDDAAPGEELLLLNHEHQPAASPFRASHAIYVRRDAGEPWSSVDRLPPALARRMLSLRGFDDNGMIVAGELVEGASAGSAIEAMLGDARVAYVHAHYATLGCFAARIDRA